MICGYVVALAYQEKRVVAATAGPDACRHSDCRGGWRAATSSEMLSGSESSKLATA